MQYMLSTIEQREVEQHKDKLSLEVGYEISFDLALRDWLEHRAAGWRQERHAEMLASEREEILRHKWIESEKAQRDLGKDAVLDWIHHYAAQWREWYEKQFDRSKA